MIKQYRILTAIIALAALSVSHANADRIILTPSPTSLAPDAAKLEVEAPAESSGLSEVWTNFGTAYAELEITELQKPGAAAGAVSIESQVIPETSGLPSLAVGIRDIGNDTYGFAADGYHGRGYYVVGGRTPLKFADEPYPVKNLSYTVGCGVTGIAGPFGSIGADLPFRMHWTVEWDSKNFNERLSMSLTNFASLQYERQADSNFVGVSLFTPVAIF
jgi:hypothetical protein